MDSLNADRRFIHAGRDQYRTSSIKDIRVKQLSFRHCISRMLLFALLAVFPATVMPGLLPLLGPVLLLAGAVAGALSFRPYLLQAEFRASDESGDHWENLLTSRHKEDLRQLKVYEYQVRKLLI